MNIPEVLRSGTVGSTDSTEDTTLTTVAGLLRCFSKEACDVAVHYTLGKGTEDRHGSRYEMRAHVLRTNLFLHGRE